MDPWDVTATHTYVQDFHCVGRNAAWQWGGGSLVYHYVSFATLLSPHPIGFRHCCSCTHITTKPNMPFLRSHLQINPIHIHFCLQNQIPSHTFILKIQIVWKGLSYQNLWYLTIIECNGKIDRTLKGKICVRIMETIFVKRNNTNTDQINLYNKKKNIEDNLV